MTFDIRARVIFCDSARREDNGKLLFVGTYLDDYVVPTMPFDSPGLIVHISITFGTEAVRLPSYVRIVVPGYSDERNDVPFRDVVADVRQSGKREASIVTMKAIPPFRIADKIDLEVSVGDDQSEEVVGRLAVRTAGELLLGAGDSQLNLPAIELFVGYASEIMPRLRLGQDGDAAAIHVLTSLSKGKTGFRLGDDDQPLWVVAGARRMWVLYTQPWHQDAAFDLRRSGHPIKFREIERNAIGRLLELEGAEAFVDPSSHVVTAKKAELVH